MKKMNLFQNKLLVLIVCLSVAAFLSCGGSQPPAAPKVDVPQDISMLEQYLQKSEAKVRALRPGAEKTIVWANPDKKEKTRYVVVYFHGLSASRQEISPLCKIVADKLGANQYYARLAGHGQDGEAMGEATVSDWLRDGAEAMEIASAIGERIIIISHSTGGTLTTWLSTKPEFNKNMFALILMSPNFYPAKSATRIALWPGGKLLTRLLVGEYRSYEPRNELEKKYYTTRYKSNALITMMNLVDLVEKSDLALCKTPVLVIHSTKDRIVNADRVINRFPQFGSAIKKRVVFNATEDVWGHVLAGDALSPSTTAAVSDIIMDFIKPLMK